MRIIRHRLIKRPMLFSFNEGELWDGTGEDRCLLGVTIVGEEEKLRNLLKLIYTELSK